MFAHNPTTVAEKMLMAWEDQSGCKDHSGELGQLSNDEDLKKALQAVGKEGTFVVHLIDSLSTIDEKNDKRNRVIKKINDVYEGELIDGEMGKSCKSFHGLLTNSKLSESDTEGGDMVDWFPKDLSIVILEGRKQPTEVVMGDGRNDTFDRFRETVAMFAHTPTPVAQKMSLAWKIQSGDLRQLNNDEDYKEALRAVGDEEDFVVSLFDNA